MDDLVESLSSGQHDVTLALRPEPSLQAFKACIDRGHVHVRFKGTPGGTELGVKLDRERTDLSNCDFDCQSGVALIVGNLILNYVPVRCTAEIHLETFAGKGHLELAQASSPAM